MKLFYILLGATPKGRNTEQHDVFFGIAKNAKDLKLAIYDFWPEAEGKIHMDGYMEVKFVDGFEIKIVDKLEQKKKENLYFLNLGGYKAEVFQELHHQLIMVGSSLSQVIKKAKQTDFYKEMDIKNGPSHIDDQYGVDIDDVAKIEDLLPMKMKEKFSIVLEKSTAENQNNKIKIGYFKL